MVRVEDELWEDAKAAARDEGTTASAVTRDALTAYVKRRRREGWRRDE